MIGGFEYSPSAFRKLSRRRKIELMVQWFHEHYEDPAVRLPYESAEGGYQWIWGGPYSADDGIQSEFSEVASFEVMEEAVDEVQSDGLFDWAPVAESQSDDDGGFEPAFDLDAFMGTRGEPAPASKDDIDQLKSAMLVQLAELKAQLQLGLHSYGMIGHNKPPGPIEDSPVSEGQAGEALNAIAKIEAEADSAEPTAGTVNESVGFLKQMARSVALWLRGRANAQVDAAITLGLGGGMALFAQRLLTLLGTATEAVLAWLHALPWPF
ncbi:hypothetical protein X745_04685 [Mesorhizobium sp. LNJC374B00]|uniref:hypothetical protein n=1 Tax=Mesorhizobium sp. LNJC372A00 TaxID=1287256 RepID=UPI0003CE1032|nr:hypothetical protein [Mesorhizobium sp. LNJC372A00]ESY58316.1 hypothetical protein X745_04685 [Mesorhizobium sp. LNJC374B00]